MKRYATAAAASRTAVSSPAAAPARTPPRRRSPAGTHPLLRLQQSYGNRFVQQWLQAQHEARPGASGDPGIDGGSGPGRIPGAGGDTSLQQDIQRARGHGQPLPPHVRAPMEQALAADFSRVRLHTDREADCLSRGLHAQAFTTGQDIFLRRGQADWASAAGRELIAHELTHVVQQRATAPGAAPALSQPHDHHEREADRTARAVAAGHQVDAASLTPATAPVVQRRYLDQGRKAGYRNWLDDTTVRKGLVEASREKLTYVDMLLAEVLAKVGTAEWRMRDWPDLEALDKALTALKYQTNTTKTSEAFTRRQQAIQTLRQEIATHRQWASDVFELTHDPKVVTLMKVGFVDSYLNALDPADLDLLHQAHLELSIGQPDHAQNIFDQLNPAMPAIPTANPPHWKAEPYATMKQAGTGDFYDFQRIRNTTLAAQRQLIAYHAERIGGDYAEMLRYKPYKHQPLVAPAGAAHLNAQSLRSWNTVEAGAIPVLAPDLQGAHGKAQKIADDSTKASRDRGKTGKAAKEQLTPDEITAIRVYTSDDYREMNAIFRDYRLDQTTANWDKYSSITKLVISGMGKLPKARGTISYRGDSDIGFGGHAGVLRKGATFRLPNLYSTTKNITKAFRGSVGYVFYNDRYGRDISLISTTPEEEVLLPPGATYKIVSQYDRADENQPWADADGKDLSTAPKPVRELADKGQAPQMRRRMLELVEA